MVLRSCWFLVAMLAISSATLPAAGQTLAPACRAAVAGHGTIEAVNADGSLAVTYDEPAGNLPAGATGDVRLADVSTAPGGHEADLREALRRWIGRSVVVHPLEKGADRWRRLVAHVEGGGRSGARKRSTR